MSHHNEPDQPTNTNLVERSKKYTALFLLMSPLPLLYYLNSALSLWNLDAFHYFLVQLIFFFFTPLFQLKRKIISIKKPEFEPADSQSCPSPAKLAFLKQKPKLALNDNFESLNNTPIESLQPKSHRFTDICNNLFEQFKTIVAKEAETDSICWEVMAGIVDPIPITVYRDRHATHRYRLECTFDNSPDAVFQAMSAEKASDSFTPDNILKEIAILEHLDPNTLILYTRTAALWPTSARDICLVQSSQKLPDQSIMTVFRSVTHHDRVIRPDSGVIRMDANIIGRWIRPIPNNPNRCSMVAYFDGDPKGWIPKSLVTFVASNFIPKALQKFNEKIIGTSYTENLTVAINHPEIRESEFDDIQSSIISSSSTVIDGGNSAVDDKLTGGSNIPSSSGTSSIPSPSFHAVSRPTFWERIQSKFTSKWFLQRLTSASVPVLIIATIAAFVSRRHKI